MPAATITTWNLSGITFDDRPGDRPGSPVRVGVALSPVPIIAAVLMLSTPKGSVNGLGCPDG